MKRSGSVIAFLISPDPHVSGGLMETFSLCRESRHFEHIHGAEVVLVTIPGADTYERNDLFENDEVVRPFRQLRDRLSTLESLVLHIQPRPWDLFYGGLAVHAPLLRAIPQLHVNVLGAPRSAGQIASLLTLTPTVTITTHHDRWARQFISDAYGVPVHHLSANVEPDRYRRAGFSAKEPVIAYSSDSHDPLRPAVLEAIRSGLPDYELVEVRDMAHCEYRELIARARHVISFGEGFDGYFVETVLSGGVPFAVFDDLFFPSPDYAEYPCVYGDYDTMVRSIVADIAAFDDEARYDALNQELYGRLAQLYDPRKRLASIERFYRGEYDFVPTPESRAAWLLHVIAEKDALIAGLEQSLRALAEGDSD
jgi:hypothetical protein